MKSLAAGLTFCFFPFYSRAGVPGGEASGLVFEAPAISAMEGTAFFHDVIVNVGKESGDEFYNFENEVNSQVASIVAVLDQAVVH